MAHSKRGASICERWSNCPGSVALIATIDKEGQVSEYAREGTVAHAIAADLLTGEKQKFKVGDTVDGIEVTEEMYDAVWLYFHFVSELLKRHNADWRQLQVETKIHIPAIDGEDTDLFGTADCILVIPFKRLIVIDYKHGAGVEVLAKDNKQLLYYALGAWLSLPDLIREDIPVIECVIVQPRLPYGDIIKHAEYEPKDLREFHSFLIEASKKCDEPNAPLVAGPHCKWCPAADAMICPAIEVHVKEVALQEFEHVNLPAPQALSGEQLKSVLDNISLAESWFSKVRAYAWEQLMQGVDIPGYKLVQKRSNRKWVDEKQAETATEVLGEGRYAPRKILSPAKMEDAIKAYKKKWQQDPNIPVDKLTYKPDNGKTIARIEDERTKLEKMTAIEEFENL